jgi:SNF2 family DNA or RNA helicase
MDGENNPGHMVVKRSSIVLKFRQPTQRKTTTSLRYKSYTAYTRIDSTPNGVQLRIYDEKKDYIYFGGYSKVLDGLFDIENVDTEAIGMTEMVRRDAKDLHNPKVHGRLWAETEFELSTQEGFDVLLVTWSIKWSFTFSLRYLPRKRPRRYLLDRLLARYFPNPDFKQNASNISTPEEFYNSVHVPSKDDPIAASLETPELATELYPFQKRAVRWLLEREGVQWSKEKKAVEKMTSTVEFSSQSFYQVVDEDGRTCWVNPVLNIVTDDITPFETVQNELKGGLLVEEMGLGTDPPFGYDSNSVYDNN